MPSCEPASKWTDFLVNSFLHILILLLIISAFFFLYVSKLSTDTFQNEIGDIIDDNLTPAIVDADKKSGGKLKSALQSLPWDKISDYYATTKDPTTQNQNSWLKTITITCVTVLALTVCLIMAVLYFSCNQCASFWTILKENAIIFLFVGLIEVSFFMLIAKHYIPVKPSLMMSTTVDSLKEKF